MKIYFNADIEKRSFEGRTQIATALKKFLLVKGCAFVESEKDADIIHYHSSGIFDSFAAAKIRKKFKKPVIYTLYSVSKTEILNHFRNHFEQIIYLHPRKTNFFLSYSAILPLKLRGFSLNKIDKVIVPSKYMKSRLFENTEIIHFGIDTKFFTKGKEKKKNQFIKVGYFGHTSVYKGLLDFARASRNFPENFKSYIHVTNLTKKVQRTLKKINPNLNIVGRLEDVREAYRDMDIIVLPYRSHLGAISNPLVLLEAMSCEKAIVTTDFKYLTEITKDSAIIVKPYSPKEIVIAIKKLEDPTLRKEMGKKAREIVKREYDREDSFAKFLELYQEIVNKQISFQKA